MPRLDVEISGSGKPLVLLHSLLQDRTSFEGIARRLAGQRKVFNVNMPGFGSSPPAASLDEAADRIAEMFGDEGVGADADICGNGLGGFVGLAMALRHGGLFNRLVLVGSALRFPDAGRATFTAMAARAASDGMAPLVDQAMLRMFSAEYIAAHQEEVAPLREVFLSIDAGVFAAACRALAALDLTESAASIRNEVLVVVGENDAATSASLGQTLAEALPNGRALVLADAGHAPHLQSPDAFVRAIAPFLDLRI